MRLIQRKKAEGRGSFDTGIWEITPVKLGTGCYPDNDGRNAIRAKDAGSI